MNIGQVFLLLAKICLVQAIEFNLGIIHGIENSMVWHNIRHAVDEWNKINRPMPFPITFKVVYPTDAFASAEDRFCDVVQHDLAGLIVPNELLSDQELTLIFSLCNRMHIPCLTTTDHLINKSNSNHFVHSISPSSGSVGKAAAGLISSLPWNSFVLVYEKAKDLVEITSLLSVYYNEHGTRTAIRVLQLPPSFDYYDSFLKYTREQLRQTNLVIHSGNIGLVHELLIRANKLNMTEYRYSYLFTHPDLALLEDFLSSGGQNYRCNISGLRLVQKSPLIKTDMALSIDAVRLFGEALKVMATRPLLPQPAALLCDANDLWSDGIMFNEELKRTYVHNSPTGTVKLDADGTARENATFIGVARQRGKFNEIGRWTESSRKWSFGEKYENRWKFKKKGDRLDLSGQKLRVVVYLEEPFVMRTDDEDGVKYDGFCIDLLKEMSKVLNFTFEILEVEDGTYGVQDETGRWNGIIGVLQRHEADLSISAVTITYSRVKVIDFTLPFMHLGIAILINNHNPEEVVTPTGSTLFTFLEPLSFSVWIALVVAYLTVAFTMCLVAKFSPYEWFDVQQIDERDRSMDNNKNQFNIWNSLWFAIGSLMQQGSDVIPRAVATRTVAVMWWMFTLITISSYTAQLAAFLTVERMSTSIESAMDLASQQKIKFGTLKNGSTMDFFRESKIPIYERMWSVMQSTSPTVFVNSSKEGIARVKAGYYAYMMESTMIDYYKGQDCNLGTIGGLLDSKGYGVAVPKGSPLRNELSKTILQLQERTILEALKNKWWKSKDNLKCPASVDAYNSATRVYGIFFVLFAGIAVAVVVAVGEYFVESKHQSPRLDFTLLGKLSAWYHKRKQPETTSGLRQRLQMYNGLYGAVPMGNMWMLDIQRRVAMAAAREQQQQQSLNLQTQRDSLTHLSLSDHGRSPSPAPSHQFEPISRSQQQSMRKLSRLIPPSDVGLLNRRISTGQHSLN